MANGGAVLLASLAEAERALSSARPKRPGSAFDFFTASLKKQYNITDGAANHDRIMQVIVQAWHTIPQAERVPFEQHARMDMQRFIEEEKAFQEMQTQYAHIRRLALESGVLNSGGAAAGAQSAGSAQQYAQQQHQQQRHQQQQQNQIQALQQRQHQAMLAQQQAQQQQAQRQHAQQQQQYQASYQHQQHHQQQQQHVQSQGFQQPQPQQAYHHNRQPQRPTSATAPHRSSGSPFQVVTTSSGQRDTHQLRTTAPAAQSTGGVRRVTGISKTVEVSCMGVHGTLYLTEQKVMCHCNTCAMVPQHHRVMTCSQFETHCKVPQHKRGKLTMRVRPGSEPDVPTGSNGVLLIRWLEQRGLNAARAAEYGQDPVQVQHDARDMPLQYAAPSRGAQGRGESIVNDRGAAAAAAAPGGGRLSSRGAAEEAQWRERERITGGGSGGGRGWSVPSPGAHAYSSGPSTAAIPKPQLAPWRDAIDGKFTPINVKWSGERCAVCDADTDYDHDQLVTCDSCGITVHQSCYGVPEVPGVEDMWMCRSCELRKEGTPAPQCCLCPVAGGALKPTTITGLWCHAACLQWIPEVTVDDVDKMEPVAGIKSIQRERWELLCSLCKQRMGAKIQCTSCYTAYHPLCGRIAGLHMEIIDTGDAKKKTEDVQCLSYCARHCTPQPHLSGVRKVQESEEGGDLPEQTEPPSLWNAQPFELAPSAPLPRCPAGCARAMPLGCNWTRRTHGTGTGATTEAAFWIPKDPKAQFKVSGEQPGSEGGGGEAVDAAQVEHVTAAAVAGGCKSLLGKRSNPASLESGGADGVGGGDRKGGERAPGLGPGIRSEAAMDLVAASPRPAGKHASSADGVRPPAKLRRLNSLHTDTDTPAAALSPPSLVKAPSPPVAVAPIFGHTAKELVGMWCRVWWPEDAEWYIGAIREYSYSRGQHRVWYEVDGAAEWINLTKEARNGRMQLLKGSVRETWPAAPAPPELPKEAGEAAPKRGVPASKKPSVDLDASADADGAVVVVADGVKKEDGIGGEAAAVGGAVARVKEEGEPAVVAAAAGTPAPGNGMKQPMQQQPYAARVPEQPLAGEPEEQEEPTGPAEGHAAVGRRVSVYNEIDGKYCNGTIRGYRADSNTHMVLYSDGHADWIVLSEERVEWPKPKIMNIRVNNHAGANQATAPPRLTVSAFDQPLPPGIPDRVAVMCNSLCGIFDMRRLLVTTGDGSTVSPTEFERLAGRASAKKWKTSLRLDKGGGVPGQTLETWLIEIGVDSAKPVRPTRSTTESLRRRQMGSSGGGGGGGGGGANLAPAKRGWGSASGAGSGGPGSGDGAGAGAGRGNKGNAMLKGKPGHRLGCGCIICKQARRTGRLPGQKSVEGLDEDSERGPAETRYGKQAYVHAYPQLPGAGARPHELYEVPLSRCWAPGEWAAQRMHQLNARSGLMSGSSSSTSVAPVVVTGGTSSVVAGNLAAQVSLGPGAAGSGRTLSMKEKLELCRATEYERIAFGKSGIHGWGLFARVPMRQDSMVVEFRGEVVRRTVAEGREAKYLAEGADCYIFNLEDYVVLDATRSGSIARFTNHCCSPSLYTKILSLDGELRLAFFARCDIQTGQELTYNYRFKAEVGEERLLCLCGAPNCTGYLDEEADIE